MRVGGEAIDAGDLTDQFHGNENTHPALREQLRRWLGNEACELLA